MPNKKLITVLNIQKRMTKAKMETVGTITVAYRFRRDSGFPNEDSRRARPNIRPTAPKRTASITRTNTKILIKETDMLFQIQWRENTFFRHITHNNQTILTREWVIAKCDNLERPSTKSSLVGIDKNNRIFAAVFIRILPIVWSTSQSPSLPRNTASASTAICATPALLRKTNIRHY